MAHCDEKRYSKLTSAISCVFVSFWNDSGLCWDPVSLSFSGSLKELLKVVTVCCIKPKLFVIILFLYIHTYIHTYIHLFKAFKNKDKYIQRMHRKESLSGWP